ncbi:MAG TPA: lipocalin-like domain-containing protein [Candidatus Methylomirabilis sp.]|nr:lipocalin-like domain-containing protein [Candidatus Methylomirabilis sp.]
MRGIVRVRAPLLILAVLAFLVSWRFTQVPGVSAAEFRLALPGYQFSFPRDHFSHDDYRTEWWYYTGHLRTQTGERYGYQVTFFRSGLAEAQANPSRWAAKNLYMAHFAIADIPRKSFQYFERLNRGSLGQAGASGKELRVWIGNWEASGDGTTQRLRAKEGEFGVDLALISQKPAVIHGENGISQKGEGRGHASHYYSLTRLKTEGTLTIRGKPVPVTGLSWMDHEFGSTQLDPGQVGWDWFSLQLDDGTELMLYNIRKTDGRPDPHSAGTWVGADARTVHLRQSDFSVEVLDRWQSPRDKGLYPARWRVSVQALGLDLAVTAAFPDQELDTAKSTQVIYWEGAVSAEGTARGRPVTGEGYVEMTGYAEPFRKKL